MRKQLFISDLANGAAWVALRLAQGAPRQLPEAIARLQSQEPVLPRQSGVPAHLQDRVHPQVLLAAGPQEWSHGLGTAPHQTSASESRCFTIRLSLGERPVLIPE